MISSVEEIKLLKDEVLNLNRAMKALKRELRILYPSFHIFSTHVHNILENNSHAGADNNEGGGVDNIKGFVLVTFSSLFLMQ